MSPTLLRCLSSPNVVTSRGSGLLEHILRRALGAQFRKHGREIPIRPQAVQITDMEAAWPQTAPFPSECCAWLLTAHHPRASIFPGAAAACLLRSHLCWQRSHCTPTPRGPAAPGSLSGKRRPQCRQAGPGSRLRPL